MVLAIGATAFVAFNLEKVEFLAILMRAAVADVLENSFVLGHPCSHESRSSLKGHSDLIQAKSSPAHLLTAMNIIVSPQSHPTHSPPGSDPSAQFSA